MPDVGVCFEYLSILGRGPGSEESDALDRQVVLDQAENLCGRVSPNHVARHATHESASGFEDAGIPTDSRLVVPYGGSWNQ